MALRIGDLENLTVATGNGIRTLSVEVKALRNVENRLVLDQLLAAQWGVCHILDEACCTCSLHVSDNITHVVLHLKLLLQTQHNRESSELN